MRVGKVPRKSIWIAAAVATTSFAVSVVYFWSVCSHNAVNTSRWNEYTSRQQAKGSIGPGLLERFQDATTTIKTHLGEARAPCGYRKGDGEVIVEPVYAACAPEFSEGLAWARTQNGEWVFIRPDGNVVFRLEAAGVWSFSSGLARIRVRESGGWTSDGFVDTKGQVVIPAKYANALDFVGNYTLVHERTFVSEIMQSFADRTGVSMGACFAYRVRIVDRTGSVVHSADLSK